MEQAWSGWRIIICGSDDFNMSDYNDSNNSYFLRMFLNIRFSYGIMWIELPHHWF